MFSATLLISGCSFGADPGDQPSAAPSPRTNAAMDSRARANTDARAASAHRACTPAQPVPAAARTHIEDLQSARAQLDAAAARATRSGHRFHSTLQLRIHGEQSTASMRARATVTGRRTARNTSHATVRWSGPLGLLLPDTTIRIAGDQVTTRSGRSRTPRARGSASGVSVDVGRELLDHPFLLTTRAAWRDRDGALHVSLDVPIDALRAYATTERQGPVTELLRDAETLRITSIVDARGRLAGDHFTLVTRVPPGIVARPLDGRRITLTARTGYC